VAMGYFSRLWDNCKSFTRCIRLITGTSTVCKGLANVSYEVPVISNASNYTWAYSGTGATINGSGNTISIDFSDVATSGDLTVKGTNTCGDGTISGNILLPLILSRMRQAQLQVQQQFVRVKIT